MEKKMTDLFASYRIIDAEGIVRKNIDPNYVREDLNDLIAALETVTDLRPRNTREREIPILDRKTVRTIKEKFGLVGLLKHYSYVLNDDHDYVFESATTTTARERCRNGMREVEDLLQDLKDARNGSLNGFNEFIGVRRPRTPPARPRTPPTRPRTPSARPRNEPHYQPLPSARDIDDGNAATLAVVKSLKQSLVSEYNANPAPRFIRRRIARLLYRHIYPESQKVTDDDVDKSIDRAVQSIKQNYQSRNPSDSDPVCIECLIRAQFDETEARKMLRENPPNLDVPVEPAQPPTGTSLATIIEPVKQQHRLLNEQNNNNNGLRRQNSQTDDRWEAVKHVAEAIQRLRQKDDNATASEEIFSQMCRVLYGELFPILGSQSLVKIELFARQICDSLVDRVENLDISTIRTVLSTDNGTRITDNFIENAGSLLSIQCPICLNGFPKNRMEVMYLCDHKCCLPCLKNHYRTAINGIQGRATLNSLTCFDTSHPIAHDVHHDFFIYLGSKVKQWFKEEDPDLVRKYDEKIFEATRGAEIKRCGNSKCVSSVYVDDNDRVTRVYCQNCNFAQCGLCCQKWHAEHSDMSCDEYTDWLKDNDPDDADVQAIKYLGNNAIVCPQCGEVFVLEAGGCEHFICPSCDLDFCRMCPEFLYTPKKARKCPYDDCTMKASFHGHCKPNCYRELRDFPTDRIINLLEENGIDKDNELENIPRPADQKCISPGCVKPTINDSGHRYCGDCYKYWLCLLIWNNQLEPWTIYDDNNLRQILRKAKIPCSEQATKDELVELCQQHLNGTLGHPKALKPRRN